MAITIECYLSGVVGRAVIDSFFSELSRLVVGILTNLIDILEIDGVRQIACIPLSTHIPCVITLIQGSDVVPVFISNHWDVIIECAGGFVHFLYVLLEADIGLQLLVGTDEGGLHREGEGIGVVAIDAGIVGLWCGLQRERGLGVVRGRRGQRLVGLVKREHSTLGVIERIVDVVVLRDVVNVVIVRVGQFQLGQGDGAALDVVISIFAR